MEIIKQEKLNAEYSILLGYYGRTQGYEIYVSRKGLDFDWADTDGFYGRKTDALKVYNLIKKEYSQKEFRDAINTLRHHSNNSNIVNSILTYAEKNIDKIMVFHKMNCNIKKMTKKEHKEVHMRLKKW